MLATPEKMAAFNRWANRRVYACCEALARPIGFIEIEIETGKSARMRSHSPT
jgi:hypothetical protein